MKYRSFIPILIAVIVAACTGLNHGDDSKEPDNWGSNIHYSNFLWHDYNPNAYRIGKTLELEFNDDARKHFVGKAVLELVTQDNQPTIDFINLYKNGVKCENNRLELTIKDSEVNIQVEFKNDVDVTTNHYTLVLKVVDNGGLDEIVNIELGEIGFVVARKNIMNPLAKQTMWFGIVIAALFVAWLILSRTIINPYLKFSRISFDYSDGAGDISHRVANCYKIICTNKPKKISLLHKIFAGNVYVEVNDFWSNEVTIICGSRNNIRLITRGEYLLPDEPVRKEPFTVLNEQHRKVIIETT